MNRERVALWTAALRSGAYHQGHGVLTRVTTDGSEEHCCLGVACRVYEQHTGESIRSGTSSDAVKYGRGGDTTTTTMPLLVREWFGIEDDDVPESAIHWNDVDQLSFGGIADRLEAMLEERQSGVTQ